MCKIGKCVYGLTVITFLWRYLIARDNRNDRRDRGRDQGLKINEKIRVRQLRLIDEEGEQQGIVDTRDAMDRARVANLDLVMVGETAEPPVARIMDYGKFRYEQQQQKKDARKRSRSQDVKSIKFRIKIDEHDFMTKVNHIRRFVGSGHKVKATIMFRGRERTHPELGQKLLQRVAEETADVAVVETRPSIAGMDMNMVLAPAEAPKVAKEKPTKKPKADDAETAPAEAASPEAAAPEASTEAKEAPAAEASETASAPEATTEVAEAKAETPTAEA